jgi:hypothetical protein
MSEVEVKAMTNHPSANVGCLLVGEYVDEGEVPEALAHHRDAQPSKAEIERPRVVGSYLDLWGREDGVKEFTVLLRDNRVATVRGHALKYVQGNTANAQDFGSYGILWRAAEGEVLVGLFRVAEVTGIFSGEMRTTSGSV